MNITEINEIAKSVEQNGVIYKKKFIDIKTVIKIKKILDKNNAVEKTNPDGIFSLSYRQMLKDLLLLKINRFLSSLFLKHINNKLGFEKIAEKIFLEKSKLVVVDGYISKISDKEILDWHQDQAYSGRKVVNDEEIKSPDDSFIKFFLFLTPVKKDNGILSYIPGSHKISIALKKAIYEKKIQYEPFWKLDDFYRLVKKEKEIILNYVSKKKYNSFLESAKFIETSKDIDTYDQNLNAGDIMIFNEHGVHRASKPSINDRYVLRFSYSRKRFKN